MVTHPGQRKSFLVGAVVLAAGAGRRFGGGKILSPYGTGRLIDGALAASIASPADRIVVVTGADAEAVAAHVTATVRDPRLEVIHAPDWDDGMSASLKTGIAALSDCDAVIVLLGDMPRIPHAILEPLIDRVRDGAPASAPVCDGARGHPVVLGASLLARAGELSGDQGAARLLDGVVLLPCADAGVLFDVDAPLRE
jgi:molybdenum cofactor cytidylyltransferase